MKISKILFALLTLLGLALSASGKEPIYTKAFSKVALEGYDSVSYFENDGQPQKGDKQYSTIWRGAEWRFASADSLAKFKAMPEKYAPAYGGYCAWAIAQGKLAKGDPKTFALVDGKLYLNYNAIIAEKWEADRTLFIKDANAKYPKLVDLKKHVK